MLLLVVLFALPSGAVHADDDESWAPYSAAAPGAKPRSGLAGLIVGGAAASLGALYTALYVTCMDDRQEDFCRGRSLAAGAVGLLIAVPAFTIGGIRRIEYKDWRGHRSLTPTVRADASRLELHVRLRF